MKQLAVISGKGGTGKTTLAAAFAQLAHPAVLADCDVDASNLPLLLEPIGETTSEPYVGGFYAEVDVDLCEKCGQCKAACRFDAIDYDPSAPDIPVIDFYACEGCGLCVDLCPVNAIRLVDRVAGTLYVSRMRYGPMIHAELGIAEGTSGKLVSVVRNRARELAEKEGLELIIIDGSPGIGCPVIASVTGTDALVIVTEPSVSGLHDLERVAELANHFGIPALVVVNKWDLNEEMAGQIEDTAKAIGVDIAGRIPFDRAFVDAMVNAKTILEYSEGRAAESVTELWLKIRELAGVESHST